MSGSFCHRYVLKQSLCCGRSITRTLKFHNYEFERTSLLSVFFVLFITQFSLGNNGIITLFIILKLIERLAYKPLRSAPKLAVLITAIGMSYLLQNSAQGY